MMLIPHEQLSAEALQGVIEDFVTRDSTDYGEFESPLVAKVAQIKSQLHQGRIVIVFDEKEENIHLLSNEQLPADLHPEHADED
jgi:uncharacterized protein